MPFFMFDSTMILLLPAIALAIWAQIRVKSAFKKYSKINSSQGYTGVKVAEYLLQQNGITDVQVESVEGTLSDHYDPRTKKVRLSANNYKGSSLAALAVSAHEVGHAIQHNKGYVPLQIRHSILPVTNIGSWAAFPLFFIGFFFQYPMLMDLGIIFFAGVVLFHFVTLPVEFNASSRALSILETNGLLVSSEITGAKKVLNAAAMTYVAATAVSLIHLIRLIILRGND
ncbi:MAG: zinc metallopeptidase [Calditrichia bacterium]|nr:zinc metallopeptidase [Calditrichia bacterium]